MSIPAESNFNVPGSLPAYDNELGRTEGLQGKSGVLLPTTSPTAKLERASASVLPQTGPGAPPHSGVLDAIRPAGVAGDAALRSQEQTQQTLKPLAGDVNKALDMLAEKSSSSSKGTLQTGTNHSVNHLQLAQAEPKPRSRNTIKLELQRFRPGNEGARPLPPQVAVQLQRGRAADLSKMRFSEANEANRSTSPVLDEKAQRRVDSIMNEVQGTEVTHHKACDLLRYGKFALSNKEKPATFFEHLQQKCKLSAEDLETLSKGWAEHLDASADLMKELAQNTSHSRITDSFAPEKMGKYIDTLAPRILLEKKSQKILNRLKDDPKTAKEFQRIEQAFTTMAGASVGSIFIRPTQRGPRFEMLTKELVKTHGDSHPVAQRLSETLTTIVGSLKQINESVRKNDISVAQKGIHRVINAMGLLNSEGVSLKGANRINQLTTLKFSPQQWQTMLSRLNDAIELGISKVPIQINSGESTRTSTYALSELLKNMAAAPSFASALKKTPKLQEAFNKTAVSIASESSNIGGLQKLWTTVMPHMEKLGEAFKVSSEKGDIGFSDIKVLHEKANFSALEAAISTLTNSAEGLNYEAVQTQFGALSQPLMPFNDMFKSFMMGYLEDKYKDNPEMKDNVKAQFKEAWPAGDQATAPTNWEKVGALVEQAAKFRS